MPAKVTKTRKSDPRQVAFVRFMVIIAVFVLWIGGIGARLVHLQVTQHDELRARALGQRRDVRQTKQLRGTIYDRNERALAISLRVQTLYADPMEMDDIPKAAKAIAKAIGEKESDLRKRLEESRSLDRRFVPLLRGLDSTEADDINRKLDTPDLRKGDLPKFRGLHWREDQKRSYPNGTLAAHLVGFSNAAGVGQAGIEQSQNDVLYGAVIKKLQERDRLGRVYDEVVAEKEEPSDVVLTVDSSIQFAAERALEDAVKRSNAAAGMAVVLSNKTGEVLAIANHPTFDPNDLGGITKQNLSNAAIQNFYSPGSVFKLVTYGAGIEKGFVGPQGEIETGNGIIQIGSRSFRDARSLGRVTYSKAMAVSSNVSAIKTAMRVGKQDLHSTIRKFGFGEPTGIELPAETGGIVRQPDRWYGDSLASMAIGYEIGVSALQMATAFATIANDGVKIQPHLIKEIRRSDDTIVSTPKPQTSRIVSSETAAALRSMLREVVVSGTGKRAAVPGYEVAGKTGTAWKFDEKLKRINSEKYISSFIGFAPANDPEVTIAVIIDEPKSGGRDGGSAAAPVFSEIAGQILPMLGVRPSLGETEETLPSDVQNVDLVADALVAEALPILETDAPNDASPNSEGKSEGILAEVPEDKKVNLRITNRPDRREQSPDTRPRVVANKATNEPRKVATKSKAGDTIEKVETKKRN